MPELNQAQIMHELDEAVVTMAGGDIMHRNADDIQQRPPGAEGATEAAAGSPPPAARESGTEPDSGAEEYYVAAYHRLLRPSVQGDGVGHGTPDTHNIKSLYSQAAHQFATQAKKDPAYGMRLREQLGAAEHDDVVWLATKDRVNGTLTGIPIADVYRRYASDVFRYVVGVTGDRALGQDLTSETFVRALKYAHTYSDRGLPARAWLVTIARNLVRDHMRSAYQRKAELLGLRPGGDIVPAVDGSADPERAAVRRELAEHLSQAMAELSVDQRECLHLRFFAGRSVAETARALNRNEQAVRAVQHRALRKLRQLLNGTEQ